MSCLEQAGAELDVRKERAPRAPAETSSDKQVLLMKWKEDRTWERMEGGESR
jgi:hypothetical protein